MPPIRIQGLTKTYKDGPRAVDNVDLEIRDGEFMVLVGPSGCGKSTMLQMLAGIVEVSSGTIHIGDQDVTRLDPRKRDIAMVFQSYALYPHLSVRNNLGFGLKLRGTDKSEIARRVEEVARILGLEEVLDRKPGALSGGQRQRVAMGRAIVREPRAFLMDEPLSNLDAKLRVSMRAQLSRLHERLGVTTVYVTHDQVEAMTLGDRVAVLRRGVLQQCDTPQVLFARPANLFVAAFIGSPAMNLLEATVEGGVARSGACRLTVGPRSALQGRVILGLRPHHLELAGPATDPAWPRITGRVEVVEELGTETQLVVGIDAPRLRAEAVRDALDAAPGDDVLLADEDRATLTAVLDARTHVATGATVELTIDPALLHAFDPDTGAAIEVDGAAVAEHALA
jgi:multiple sugar transport system ATP-binding protein